MCHRATPSHRNCEPTRIMAVVNSRFTSPFEPPPGWRVVVYIAMAYTVMADVVMAYTDVALVVMAYIAMANIVIAYKGIAYIVIAFIVLLYRMNAPSGLAGVGTNV